MARTVVGGTNRSIALHDRVRPSLVSQQQRFRYPISLVAIVDIVAVVSFYAGFFLPAATLHLIRTLRILRLLKFYRYSVGLQLLGLGFYRAREELKAIGFATFVLIFASQAATYESERYAQPEVFGSLSDAFWFTCVTVTTVGYGDTYPVTTAGRIVTMLTFVVGGTLFGTFAGVMKSAFAGGPKEQLSTEINDEACPCCPTKTTSETAFGPRSQHAVLNGFSRA